MLNGTDYYTFAEITCAIDGLATKYQKFATSIGQFFEPSALGKNSRAIIIDSDPAKPKDTLMVIGGIHGHEWGSTEIAINLAADLLGAVADGNDLNYGGKQYTSAQIKALLDKVQVVIFPLVNPDGRVYSRDKVNGSIFWRKNLSGMVGSVAGGVDINRNFDFLFDFNTKFAPASVFSASTDPDDSVYQGPGSFSEPESRNVRELLDRFPRTRWFIDLHSGSHEIQHSWGDDEIQSNDDTMNFREALFDGDRGRSGDGYQEFMPPKDVKSIDVLSRALLAGVKIVRGSNPPIFPSFQFGAVGGMSHDYAYSRHLVDGAKGKILGLVVEWSDDAQPEWAEMQNIVLEVTCGLIGFATATQTLPP